MILNFVKRCCLVVACLLLLSCAREFTGIRITLTKGAKKADLSGPVKFIQLDLTAPVSPQGGGEKLDKSMGEVKIEALVTDLEVREFTWSLENRGNESCYVIRAEGDVSGAKIPLVVEPRGRATFRTRLAKGGYAFIVVDSEKDTLLIIRGEAGGITARNPDGRPCGVQWFGGLFPG